MGETPLNAPDFGFDLAAHQMEGRRLAVNPDGTGVVRWVILEDQHKLARDAASISTAALFDGSQEHIDLLLSITQQHFDVLQQYGMNLPPTMKREVADEPFKLSFRPRPTIYTSVTFIEGTRLDQVDVLPAKTIATQIVEPLLDYYQWVIESKQPYFLVDLIADPGNGGYSGDQHTLLADGETLVLHDVDPNICFNDLSSSRFMGYDIFSVYELLSKSEFDLVDEQEFDRLDARWHNLVNLWHHHVEDLKANDF